MLKTMFPWKIARDSSAFPLKRGMPKIFTLVFFSVMLSFQLLAQTGGIAVKGRVTDDKGGPVAGASVTEKGTASGTVTDAGGQFSITVKNQSSVIIISFVGFAAKEIEVGNKVDISVALSQTDESLENVVVVAYGTQRKVTVTGAVSALRGEKLIKSPAVDLTNSLAGRLPGLVVIQQSGEPGYDGATLSPQLFMGERESFRNNSPGVFSNRIIPKSAR